MIYELREYVAADGMADRLHARFADHTFELFARHGLELIGFWTDAEDPARIVYLLRFPDDAARREAWAGFRNDAKWQQVKAASEADGPIVAEMYSRVLTTPPYVDGAVA